MHMPKQDIKCLGRRRVPGRKEDGHSFSDENPGAGF